MIETFDSRRLANGESRRRSFTARDVPVWTEVSHFLRELGYEHHVVAFHAEGFRTMEDLAGLTDAHLKELGVAKMRDRAKILSQIPNSRAHESTRELFQLLLEKENLERENQMLREREQQEQQRKREFEEKVRRLCLKAKLQPSTHPWRPTRFQRSQKCLPPLQSFCICVDCRENVPDSTSRRAPWPRVRHRMWQQR